MEKKTNLTLPSYVWVWGGNGQVAECRRGGNGCGFFVFVWDERPPQRKSYFLFRVCFLWDGEYTGREVWQKLHRGGGHPPGWWV